MVVCMSVNEKARSAGGAVHGVHGAACCCMLLPRARRLTPAAYMLSGGLGSPGMRKRPRAPPCGRPLSHPLGDVSWASLPQGLLEQVLTSLPLRSVAAAARTCQTWAPAARVVRLRAQLEEALLDPREIIWRRYSGGAERMGRAGYTHYAEEVCGWEGAFDDNDWTATCLNASTCGGTASTGINRAGFLHGEYVVGGRDAAADADSLVDEAALRALVAEAAACGPPVRRLREALEDRLAEAARRRPMWTATAPQLLESLAAHQDDVETVQRCCRQLNQLVAGRRSQKDLIGEVGGALLVVALRAHPGAETVQVHGCSALGNLMHEHPANQTAVAAVGGIDAMVAALHAQPGAEAMQCTGCTALGNLVYCHPANQTSVAAAGGIEAVMAALRAHPGVHTVQADGCFALGNLVREHPANQTAVTAAGGIEAVVAALQAHLGVETVQFHGCDALSSLAHEHPANQTAVMAAGGIGAVAAALRAHPDAETVQVRGCDALGNLVYCHPANQTSVAAAGGIEAVMAALRAHPGAEEVQCAGCTALGWLVCDHPANQTLVAVAGGIDAVMAALRAHPGAEEVQEDGCHALGLLVHAHPTNIASAVAAGAIGVLVAACGRYAAGTDVHEGAASLLEIMRPH
eukprot:COSAG01_NODE_9622_length_2386_cov_10.446436_2_plen_633_part_00